MLRWIHMKLTAQAVPGLELKTGLSVKIPLFLGNSSLSLFLFLHLKVILNYWLRLKKVTQKSTLQIKFEKLYLADFWLYWTQSWYSFLHTKSSHEREFFLLSNRKISKLIKYRSKTVLPWKKNNFLWLVEKNVAINKKQSGVFHSGLQWLSIYD